MDQVLTQVTHTEYTSAWLPDSLDHSVAGGNFNGAIVVRGRPCTPQYRTSGRTLPETVPPRHDHKHCCNVDYGGGGDSRRGR